MASYYSVALTLAEIFYLGQIMFCIMQKKDKE